jgi:tRNA G46 methylase TrmB
MRYYDNRFVAKPQQLTNWTRNQLHRNVFSGLDTHSILEVGVGAGHLAHYCRNNSISWVGIEPNDTSRNQLIAEGFTVYNGVIPVFPEITENLIPSLPLMLLNI